MENNTVETKVSGPNILAAIDLANAVRAVGGFPLVDDLVPGIPGDPSNCVLAQTFNCDCDVMGRLDDNFIINKDSMYYNSAWYVWFQEEKYAVALARELNRKVYKYDIMLTPISTIKESAVQSGRTLLYGVGIPEDVARIARDFDDGTLEEKYYDLEEDD